MIELGRLLIPLATVATLVAATLYWLEHRDQARVRPTPGGGRLRWARFAFYLQTACLEVVAAILLSAILTHRFDLDYVFGHSSTDLPLIYLIASFWAGQEGTFVLWSLYSAFIGLALMSRGRDWEPTVMAVFTTLHLALLAMLLVRSPFAALDIARFTDNDQQLFRTYFSGVPPQGQGLNELLQNPWMAIHPPILFLGFASMAAPFTLAIAGMLRGDLDGWVRRAQAWTLLAWCILGTGLILGGYWAYETLGWGGYWAWDPVENSSLVPWLFAGALFHGMILQRTAPGALRRFNLLLAGLCFGSVTYGSYLNRSGVLSDFSVHSFVALSPVFNRALLAFAILAPLAFLAVWWGWARKATSAPVGGEAFSRKRLLHVVVLLLFGSGALVLLGNSWPLLSALPGLIPGVEVPRSSLQPPFYNQTHTPLAMVMAMLLSMALLVGWDTVSRERLLARWRIPALLAAAVAGATVYAIRSYLVHRADLPDLMPATAGRLAWAWATLIVLATFAAAVNLGVLVSEARRGERWSLGTHVAHTGFMVLVLGIVVSSVYETKGMVALPLDQPVRFAGYTLTYEGLVPRAIDAEVRIEAEDSRGRRTVLTPILRPTRDQLLRQPGILKSLSHDLYIEPGELQAAQDPDGLMLDIDMPLEVGDDLTLKFAGFDLERGQQLDPSNFSVGVIIDVEQGEAKGQVTPVFEVRGNDVVGETVPLPGGGRVAVVNMPARGDGQHRIELRLEGVPGVASRTETAIVQTTVKPAMSVVWLGCWLTILGGLWAALRRAREARRTPRRPTLG